MKNAFYFILKALLVLKIFNILSWIIWYMGKQLDKKAKINFKIYDVKIWERYNNNTYIAQHFKKGRRSDNKIWSVK